MQPTSATTGPGDCLAALQLCTACSWPAVLLKLVSSPRGPTKHAHGVSCSAANRHTKSPASAAGQHNCIQRVSTAQAPAMLHQVHNSEAAGQQAREAEPVSCRAATIYNPSLAVGSRWSGLLADSGLDRLYHSGGELKSHLSASILWGPICASAAEAAHALMHSCRAEAWCLL